MPPAHKLFNMPKGNFMKIDGVSYNVDHAKKVGKDVFVKSNLKVHFQHLADQEQEPALGKVFDQLVAPIPTSPTPAAAQAAAAIKN